jgi:uncharacterized Zn-binding protein involved in type VI secretion
VHIALRAEMIFASTTSRCLFTIPVVLLPGVLVACFGDPVTCDQVGSSTTVAVATGAMVTGTIVTHDGNSVTHAVGDPALSDAGVIGTECTSAVSGYSDSPTVDITCYGANQVRFDVYVQLADLRFAPAGAEKQATLHGEISSPYCLSASSTIPMHVTKSTGTVGGVNNFTLSDDFFREVTTSGTVQAGPSTSCTFPFSIDVDLVIDQNADDYGTAQQCPA